MPVKTNLTEQAKAFALLFDEKQRIAFQKGLDTKPNFLVYPFYSNPQGTQFFVLNSFLDTATKRNGEGVLGRQGVTVEQDFMGLDLQRKMFAATIGKATVACFSGNKSIHFHIRFTHQISLAEEKLLVEMLKKAFPLSDWSVLSDKAKLCRIPNAIRTENGKRQAIEYLGERLDFARLIDTLQAYTSKISVPAEVANHFAKLFSKQKYTSSDVLLQGHKQNRLPSLPDALLNLLNCGYSLSKACFETLAFLEHSLIRENWDVALNMALQRHEEENLNDQIKQIKTLPPKESWRKQAVTAMSGRWQEFYEKHGIDGIKAFSGGWHKGFTPGKHKNKAPGFAFRPDNGAFYSFYDGSKGFPQNFLNAQDFTLDQAWEKIAQMAGVEIPKTLCKFCQQAIKFVDKKPVNLDDSPHKCQVKQPKQNKNLRLAQERKNLLQETASEVYLDDNNRVVTGVAAEFFVKRYNGKILYNNESFWVYEHGVWMQKNDKFIRQQIACMLGKTLAKKSVVEDILYLLVASLYNETHGLFNSYPHLLNLKNGMLDIYTDTLLPHDPKYFSNIQLNFNAPIDAIKSKRDPKLLATLAPVWTKVLQSLEFEPQTYWRLQQWGGYCLTRDTRIEKCLFLKGEGANGKSTFLEGFLCVLKDFASNMEIGQLFDKFKLADIEGKLVNIGTDIDTSSVVDPMFKKIVSGEFVQVERKHKDPHKFRPFCKFLFSANDFLPSKDRSHGFFRRFDVIEFKKQFSPHEQDESIKEAIKSGVEAQGIFLWMYWGLKDLLANNWKMVQSDEFDASKADFEMATNPLKQFISEVCTVDKTYKDNGEPMLWILASSFRQKYVQWCLEKGYEPMAENKLGRELKHLGFENSLKRTNDGKRSHVYFGIAF